MKKALEDGSDVQLAWQSFRNTVREGYSASPAQLLFSRRCRTSPPMQRTMLNPQPLTRYDVFSLCHNCDGRIASCRCRCHKNVPHISILCKASYVTIMFDVLLYCHYFESQVRYNRVHKRNINTYGNSSYSMLKQLNTLHKKFEGQSRVD